MRVHVIFKTHLDIGFTNLARNVVARYFDEFIPAAINVARNLREQDTERFIWTTGSWLIYEYLEQADNSARQQLEEAIAAGDIAWHALPFSTHTELMNRALFRHGLSLSRRLDERFGRKTVAAKMTDVPGHTRAMIPLLADAGVEFLHIGINPASTAAAVPDVFRWQHPGGSSVVVMYDKGDYGQTTINSAANAAVHFAHTRDNEPPQTANEIQAIYRQLRSQFPTATIVGSTLCDVARSLRPHQSSLPIVDGEIGDSWIYGAASDPLRMTPYRAAARTYAEWIDRHQRDSLQPQLDRFARHLMLVPEHTWGLLVESLDDETSLHERPLQQLRSSDRGQQMEASWQEQREQVALAINSLSDSQRAQVQQAVNASVASQWSTDGWTPTMERSWELEAFNVAVSESGAITQLECKTSGREWANDKATLGQFVYESFSAGDFARFFDEYVKLDVDWARRAYMKQVPADMHASTWLPSITRMHTRSSSHRFEVLSELVLPHEAVEQFGAPRLVQSRWAFALDGSQIEYEVQWFGKQATRRPTAAWVGFVPELGCGATHYIHKLGEWIAPGEVVKSGGRMLHGCDLGVRFQDGAQTMTVASLDASIVAPARRSLLRFDNREQPAQDGMHFCLWNNVWNTNFPLWHDRDEKFRFNVVAHSADQRV